MASASFSAACSSEPFASAARARTLAQATFVFSVATRLRHLLRFGVLLSRRHAKGRAAKAQSGCLSLSAASEPVSGAKVPHTIHRWAVCPAAASELGCAVARHATSSKHTSRSHGWRRHCLAFCHRGAFKRLHNDRQTKGSMDASAHTANAWQGLGGSHPLPLRSSA